MPQPEFRENVQASSESRPDAGAPESHAALTFDPIKLLGDTGSLIKSQFSKSVASFGTPILFDKNSSEDKSAASKPAAADGRNQDIQSIANNKEIAENKAVPANKLPEKHDAVTNRVIDRLKESTDPVQDIKSALQKLDNLQDASLSKSGNTSHVEINLKAGQTVAPPNIQVRGFRPVASHIGSHVSFDFTKTNNGVVLSNMDGLSGSVQGPLGRIRHSETSSMFIGKDSQGPYVQTTSDLYMRRRVHTSTTTLRENNFPPDSPMRSAMQHPEALEQVGSLLRMFQNADDIGKLGIKRNGDAFDVKSEAKSAKHVDLNFKPDKLPFPVTVESLDLDKNLTATLAQGKDAVSLDKITGLKVNVDLAGAKTTVCPTRVSVEKDMLKIDLKNPNDGEILPLAIPIARLKEAAAKQR